MAVLQCQRSGCLGRPADQAPERSARSGNTRGQGVKMHSSLRLSSTPHASHNSTQTLRTSMETVDTGGSCGQKNGRRFWNCLKRRPS